MRLTLLLFLASFFLQTSCTNKEAVNPKQIRIALESSPKTIDPRRATDANGQRLAGLLFQSFVKLGPDMEIIGDAAMKFSFKDKQLTMTLYPNIKFSNGEELTAEDIHFSFSEFTKKTSIFANAYKEIDAVLVSNDNKKGFHVIVKLKEPSATLLTDLSPLKILQKKYTKEVGQDFQTKPLGTGAYKLEKMSANEILLTKNPHFQHEVLNDSLLFKVIKDDSTRYLKVLKGSIDLAPNVLSPQSSKKLLENEKFNTTNTSGLAMNYLLLNLKDPALSQIAFRKAIAHSINRKDIIKFKLEGLASTATSILTPKNPYFHDGLQLPKFDLEAGKKELAKVNNPPKEITIKTSNKPSAVENAKILASQIEKLGIKVKIQSFEWGTFFDDVKSGNFQIATMRWVGATDPDIYRIAFHSSEHPPGRNRGFYTNKKLDQLLDKGNSILSIKDRITHFKQVQEIVINELPTIPLWYNNQINIVGKDIKGFKVSETGDFSYFRYLHR